MFFSKLHFSTRLEVELEQLLSDGLQILTVFVSLNYLQNYASFFFRYVENYSSYKAFFTIVFTRKKNFLFGAQDGGVWNRRVYVGSLENLDLGQLKVENKIGKVKSGDR